MSRKQAKKKLFLWASIFLIVIILYIYNLSCFIKQKDFKSSYSSIQVVLDDNYPPYSFKAADGTLQGVSVDQWRLWESKTGIKVQLTAGNWNSALFNMKQGSYDVIDNIFITKERNNIFDFTPAYADIEVSIFFNKNISGIINEDAIKGFNVAVKKGDYTEEYLRERGIIDFSEYEGYEDIIKDAKAGKVNVFVMDKPPALYYLYKYGIISNFKYTEPLYSSQFHRAVVKGNQELLNTVETGFSFISKSEYMAVDKKWFGISNIYLKYSPYLLFIAVIVILILTVLSYAANFFRRKIKEKNKELTKTEKSYTELFNNLKIGVALFSRERKLILCNPIFMELFEVSRDLLKEDVRLEQLLNLIVKADGSKMDYAELNVNKTFETGLPIKDFTLGIKNSEGVDIIWATGDSLPRFDESGQVESVLLTLVNITERIKASRMLKESQNKTRTIIKAIPDLILMINTEGRFLEYLSEEEHINLYVPEKNLINKYIRDVYSERTAKLMYAAIDRVISTGGLEIVEYSVYMNCELYYYESRLFLLEEDKILVLVRDITERKNADKRIYEMSMSDITTGLYNRNYFEKKLSDLKVQNAKNIGIIICDIDGLKLINDTMGHTEGDNLIKNAADILGKCCKKQDVIARIGGDEFAVIVINTSEPELDIYKNRIIDAAEELNVLKPVIPVSMSVGYSFSRSSEDLIKSFKDADTFMYREKLHHHQSKRGKNIELLSKMLEARDFITEGHGERMQCLCVGLAKAIGMTDAQIKDIVLFAQFHDIGKVGIPDAILFKPGKLDAAEQQNMMRHTEIGYRIAESSPDIIHISDWILKHHERWDGMGYPYGLKKDEIPVQCRILAIVDAYDAMTNDRPYRKAMNVETAVAEIRRCAGTQFDPYLAEKFIYIL